MPVAGSNRHWTVEGVADTTAIVLVQMPDKPRKVVLEDKPVDKWVYSEKERLLWIHFANEPRPRNLSIEVP